MIQNQREKEIKIKIVYYGCAMSGKTTSLKFLLSKLNNASELTSVETTTGRTLALDFGTYKVKGGDWTIKFLLFSATGQDFYAVTRKPTLTGADGIIFIIDSQKDLLEDNLRSWKELIQYYPDYISKIPIILCLNKRDLPNIIEIKDIEKLFDLNKYEKIDIIKTVAINGDGVLEAFKKLLEFLFPSIVIK